MNDTTAVNAVENAETTVTDPTQTTTVIEAKRGRGRPRLAETAYDRAAAIMVATGATDSATLLAAVVAIGIKKVSAAVYLHKARKAGVVAPAPTA